METNYEILGVIDIDEVLLNIENGIAKPDFKTVIENGIEEVETDDCR